MEKIRKGVSHREASQAAEARGAEAEVLATKAQEARAEAERLATEADDRARVCPCPIIF